MFTIAGWISHTVCYLRAATAVLKILKRQAENTDGQIKREGPALRSSVRNDGMAFMNRVNDPATQFSRTGLSLREHSQLSGENE